MPKIFATIRVFALYTISICAILILMQSCPVSPEQGENLPIFTLRADPTSVREGSEATVTVQADRSLSSKTEVRANIFGDVFTTANIRDISFDTGGVEGVRINPPAPPDSMLAGLIIYTFQAGETSKSFKILVREDNNDAVDERLTIRLQNLSAYRVGAANQLSFVFIDNDKSTLSLGIRYPSGTTAENFEVSEAGGTVTLIITARPKLIPRINNIMLQVVSSDGDNFTYPDSIRFNEENDRIVVNAVNPQQTFELLRFDMAAGLAEMEIVLTAKQDDDMVDEQVSVRLPPQSEVFPVSNREVQFRIKDDDN